MRSNRPNYSASPAGSAKALDQKPKPKRSKKELNQLMLMLFFIVLPVVGLLAIFFQPMRWVFMLIVVAALTIMWLLHAFLFPGRMIISAVYGLLLVFTLVTALGTHSRSDIRSPGTNPFPSIPVPTSTPAFAAMYNTMGTPDPDGFYSVNSDISDIDQENMTGSPDDLMEVGLSGGSEDQSGGTNNDDPIGYTPEVKSGAEIALENFMEKWRKGIIADMVEFTAKSWQDSKDEEPAKRLFWKFKQKPLEDWRQMSPPTGTDESTARTITIQADVDYGGVRTYEYDAIVLYENGVWAVDPESLSTGVLVVAATPTPDPNVTPTPSPEPTPTPKPSGKTKLYYNKNGKFYHADPECESVSKEYRPIKNSFQYKDINKSPYDKYQPCTRCDAPPRS